MHNLVSSIFDDDLHAKRVASLANAVVGALVGARLAVATLGRALAIAKNRNPKHGIKQVDRFFSNTGVDVWHLFASWVPFVVGPRPEIMVALDWTEFDADNQSTIALYLVTRHGRATPLLWKTVVKSEMKGWRNEHEDVLLERFREVLPEGVKVTVLADRGFGDQALYELLKEQLGFDFVVRFRGIVKVTDEGGVTKTANEWVPENGRPRLLRKARVTKTRREVGAVVCVKAKEMKEPWCLATSLADETGAEIIKRYGKRFTIEETFRDLKNLRFGMGLSDTRISSPERRDSCSTASPGRCARAQAPPRPRPAPRQRSAPPDEGIARDRVPGVRCLENELLVLPHVVDRLPLPVPRPLRIGEAALGFPARFFRGGCTSSRSCWASRRR